MTPEAERYLRSLVKENPSVIYEWLEQQGQIERVTLKFTEMSQKEIELALIFAKNGSPEITVEWREGDVVRRCISSNPSRSNGLNFTEIFTDECQDLYMVKPVSEKSFNNWFASGGNKKGGITVIGLNGDLSERRLKQRLLEEEAKENYEMCAEILKYAESKGFDLNGE